MLFGRVVAPLQDLMSLIYFCVDPVVPTDFFISVAVENDQTGKTITNTVFYQHGASGFSVESRFSSVSALA